MRELRGVTNLEMSAGNVALALRDSLRVHIDAPIVVTAIYEMTRQCPQTTSNLHDCLARMTFQECREYLKAERMVPVHHFLQSTIDIWRKMDSSFHKSRKNPHVAGQNDTRRKSPNPLV